MDRGTKNKLVDIDEILAKSQRLMTHNGFGVNSPSGTRNVSRGVAELTEFSRQWAKESVDDQGNLEAFRLLSQKNFDAKKLFEDVRSIQVKAVDDSSMRLEGTDIEGYLAHQHDMIILTAIEEAKQGAEDHVQEMQRRWAASEWAQARHKFMESLGHRAYRWEGQSAPTPAKDFSNALTVVPAGNAQFSSPTPQKGSSIFSPSSAAASHRSKPLYGGAVAKLDTRAPLSDLLSCQAGVIRRLNLSSHSSAHLRTDASGAVSSTAGNREPVPAPGSVKPYAQLASCVRVPEHASGRALVCDGLSKAELLAYKAHLQLLASAVGETNVQRGSASSARELMVSHSSTRQIPAAFASTPGETGVPPAGYFAGLCLDLTDFSPTAASSQFQAAEERRQWLTQGSKSYLEVQYWDVLSHSLDEAVQRDGWQVLSSTEGSSRQQRLRSYVAYLQNSRQLPAQCANILATSAPATAGLQEPLSPSTPMSRYRSTSSNAPSSAVNAPPAPLWVFIYHCLRVGDLTTVTTELSACLTRGHCEGGAAALTVLQTILQLQAPGATSRQSARGTTSLPEHESRALVDAMQQCRAQFERGSHSDESTCDPYRQLVFNLLGLANKEDLASNAIPGFSLEDFLWSHLWFIQHVRMLQPSLGSGAFNTPLVANERVLFELILEYGGADYFDEDRSNPFRYAMVLSCCQRFGDAVAHLWQCNKILPAVHLTSVALHYGLVLPHVPLEMNPSHPMIMGGRFVNGSSFATNQDPTPASVLQYFGSTPLLMAYPSIVTDYLVSLDSNWLSHAQGIEPELKETLKMKSQSVVSGVLESFLVSLAREQLVEVVGEPLDASKTGALSQGIRTPTRTSGARLDDYLSTVQIELLLARAAYNLLTQRQEAEAAIYLYLLAGRYAEVVEEMCTQLAAVLIPQVHPTTKQRLQSHEAVRAHWREYSEAFIDRYLYAAAGTSTVMHALTQSGHRALADTLLVLTSLFSFVDAVYAGEGGAVQALKVLDQLQLLPVNEQQAAAYVSYSPLLRPVMDDLLLMAMETTTRAYQTIQMERSRTSSTTSGAGQFSGLLTDRDIQLQGLKQRAAALVSFANKIKTRLNRPDTVGMLTRLEASIA